jgi:hypothetical protein
MDEVSDAGGLLVLVKKPRAALGELVPQEYWAGKAFFPVHSRLRDLLSKIEHDDDQAMHSFHLDSAACHGI